MKLSSKLTGWLSIATGLYHASRMFASGIGQLYLLSLGFSDSDLLHFHIVHSLFMAGLDFPISLCADTFNRKAVIFAGLFLEMISYACYFYLGGVQRCFPTYKYLLVYCADCLHMLGKNSLSGTLESWVLSILPSEGKQLLYRDYAHKTESVTAIFSIVSGCLGIFFSAHSSYSMCYCCALLTQIIVIGLFCYCAFYEQSTAIEVSNQASHHGPSRVIPKTAKQDAGFLHNASLAAQEVYGRSTGWLALLGTVCIAAARLLYHFWQRIFFGSKIRVTPQLPLALRNQLLAFTIAMFLGHLIFNEFLKRKRQKLESYVRRGQILLGIGVLSAAALCFPLLNGDITSGLLPILFGIVLFACVQGATGCLETLQSTLFARLANPAIMASALSLIGIANRLVSIILTIFINQNATFWFEKSGFFFIPLTAFSLFCLLLPAWLRASRHSPRVETTDTLRGNQ